MAPGAGGLEAKVKIQVPSSGSGLHSQKKNKKIKNRVTFPRAPV